MEIAPGYTHEQCLEDAENFVSFLRGDLGYDRKEGDEVAGYAIAALVSANITDDRYFKIGLSLSTAFYEKFKDTPTYMKDYYFYLVHPENGVTTEELGVYLETSEGTLYLVERD